MEELREEPEGRPGGQGKGKRARGDPPSCFKVPWSYWPSFWLFPGNPVNPSNLLILQQDEIGPPEETLGRPRKPEGLLENLQGPYKALKGLIRPLNKMLSRPILLYFRAVLCCVGMYSMA